MASNEIKQTITFSKNQLIFPQIAITPKIHTIFLHSHDLNEREDLSRLKNVLYFKSESDETQPTNARG